MAVMVTVQEALARFFKLGSVLTLFGSVHMLSLLLEWYVVSSDTVARTSIYGYNVAETLMMSIVAGLTAGLGLLVSTFSRRVRTARLILASLALLGGVLALFSPLYLMFIKIPRLSVSGQIEWGIFVSIFSAIALLAVGALVAMTRLGERPSPRPSYYGRAVPEFQTTQVPATPVTGTTVFEPVESVTNGAVCTICYQELGPEDTMKCSSCEVLYHRGCIDSWVNLNGTCPNCKSVAET